MEIEKLLNGMEDKVQNLTTTSLKFKRDLWEWCQFLPQRNLVVEYGTHKGQTTRILSHLFDEVYTYNLVGGMDSAKKLNDDRTNINYIEGDLYSPVTNYEEINLHVDLVLIDAVHTTDAVYADYLRTIELFNVDENTYFVFDDYGMYPEVKYAVDGLIATGCLKFVKEVGHPRGHTFGQGRTLNASEGLICKYIQQ